MPSDAVLLKVDRFGQRFERRGCVQGAVRPVLIMVSFVLAQDPPQMGLVGNGVDGLWKATENAYDVIVGLTNGGPGTATMSVAMSQT